MFNEIGGHEVIKNLVRDFYHIMQTDPKAAECLATHAGRDLKVAEEKLTFFLSGWTGGPQLYLEKYGHPRLRMRHSLFRIGLREAEQWLYCMKEALQRSTIHPDVQEKLLGAFQQVTAMLTEGHS